MLYRNPIYPPTMIVKIRISHRDKEIYQVTDQKIEKPENIRKGRTNQFSLRYMKNLDKRSCLLRIQMERVASINHSMVSTNTNRGINQMTPINAEKLDEKNAPNANKDS